MAPNFGNEPPAMKSELQGDLSVGFICDPEAVDRLIEKALQEIIRLQVWGRALPVQLASYSSIYIPCISLIFVHTHQSRSIGCTQSCVWYQETYLLPWLV